MKLNVKINFFIIIALISFYILLCGIRGSIQDRIDLFKNFSFDTIKFILKTIIYFIFTILFMSFLGHNLKINLIQKNKAKIYFLIIAWLLYFCSLSLLILKKWALNRFPIDNPETVYFVLGNPKELSGFDKSILFELAYIEVLIFLISLLFFIFIFLYEKRERISCFSIKIKKVIYININVVYFIFQLFMLFVVFVDLYHDLNIKDYLLVIKNFKTPLEDSDFYISEYIKPEYGKIVFPQNKKNLILIFMESMESSYADEENGGLLQENLIPNLTNLASGNVNFSSTEKLGGGIDLAGTGCKMSA